MFCVFVIVCITYFAIISFFPGSKNSKIEKMKLLRENLLFGVMRKMG